MRELDIVLSVAPYLADLEGQGYDVLAVEDFDEVERRFPRTGRAAQTPMMSIARQDFARSDAFWLFLLKDGQTLGGMGAKLTDLDGESFESYLRRTSRHQYGRDADPVRAVAPPVARALNGRLIYMGELEFLPGARGRPGILRSYTRIMQGLCAMKWRSFDWMYAFIPDEHYHLARYYGLTWSVPNAITWTPPAPRGRLDTHWLMGISRGDYEHLVSAERRGLVARRPA